MYIFSHPLSSFTTQEYLSQRLERHSFQTQSSTKGGSLPLSLNGRVRGQLQSAPVTKHKGPDHTDQPSPLMCSSTSPLAHPYSTLPHLKVSHLFFFFSRDQSFFSIARELILNAIVLNKVFLEVLNKCVVQLFFYT